ncbi:MAG TPA: hypothetical protein VNT75_05590 [Symbiobacteriaceae bacterium]|nr:hypothetical protein [Symbiobacteriaceae bacterium]
MSSINWKDGQFLELQPGDTATCTTLVDGQLYGLFFYNSEGHDTDSTVTIVWSSSKPPLLMTVPGTTAKKGLASICFVSGSDTSTVAASLPVGQPGKLQCFICSVKFPMGSPQINNQALPADGQMHAFQQFTRFFFVPEAHWYRLTLQSSINQFISVVFKTHTATVYVVNKIADPVLNIFKVGAAANEGIVTVEATDKQTIDFTLQGTGQQYVLMNADSVDNSQKALVALQSLAALYALTK